MSPAQGNAISQSYPESPNLHLTMFGFDLIKAPLRKVGVFRMY